MFDSSPWCHQQTKAPLHTKLLHHHIVGVRLGCIGGWWGGRGDGEHQLLLYIAAQLEALFVPRYCIEVTLKRMGCIKRDTLLSWWYIGELLIPSNYVWSKQKPSNYIKIYMDRMLWGSFSDEILTLLSSSLISRDMSNINTWSTCCRLWKASSLCLFFGTRRKAAANVIRTRATWRRVGHEKRKQNGKFIKEHDTQYLETSQKKSQTDEFITQIQ